MRFHDKTPKLVSSLISVPWLPSLSWEEQEQGSAAWFCCVQVLWEIEGGTIIVIPRKKNPGCSKSLNLCLNFMSNILCIYLDTINDLN